MSDPIATSKLMAEVVVQLLDPNSGRPVQTWTFRDRPKISIGRAEDREVEISDPYVSRHHASLEYRDGQWLLVSLGRNGVVVANQLVTEHPVGAEVNFRLGMEGPTLRFRTVAEKTEIQSTISFDSLPSPLFQLDDEKLQQDIDAIADGDYFQQLQQRAQQMRRHRKKQ